MTTRELPKQYEHLAAQERWYKRWKDEGRFDSTPDPAKKPFTIVIPPPNVTGALHLGHALNNTLQDLLIRWRRMQGWNALWIPGTDHAGIATQAVVERRVFEQEKKSRHDLGREELVKRIWAWKDQYEARILGQLAEMGASCDWSRTRFTLDPQCTRAVRHTFFRFFRDGLIYRGLRLVNWDMFLQTAVSDDELFTETVAGHFWHFRYPVIDPRAGEPEFVEVATTRPETMLGDTAVAVHPDPAAALDAAEADLKKRLSEAGEKDRGPLEDQLKALAERRTTHLPLLVKLRDMAKAGRKLRLPLMDREIPLVADEWAKPELGTGCVKITPAHDPNDYEVGKRQNLPMINVFTKNGLLNATAGKYAGLKIAAAREAVVADLEALGLLGEVEDRQIEMPHSDRSKTAIEPLLTEQWFVKMDRLAQTAMDAVTSGKVKITPARYAKSYLDWLSEKRDWPVSRQLWWGHRIPIWYCSGCTQEELEAAFKGRSDVSWRKDDEYDRFLICAEETQLAEDAVPGHTLVQDEDVLDTWFSSALWPHSTLGWPEPTEDLKYYYPTSVLITSRDIITLWVARMVLTGVYNVGDVPFKDVYIHPKILDGDGEGMSKSKGNGVDPLDVVQMLGADALRFALCYLTTETQDVRMPVEYHCPHCEKAMPQTKQNRMKKRIACASCGKEFKTQWAESEADRALPQGFLTSDRFDLGRNFCNKLWNASRFAMLNLEGFTPAPVADSELMLEDRWLLSRLNTVTKRATQALEEFRFADYARELYSFAWDEFCSFYVEIVKSRLADPHLRPAAQRVLAAALDQLLRLLHPAIPYVTEEVWDLLREFAPERGLGKTAPPTDSIMQAAWPSVDEARIDADVEARFGCFQQMLTGLREVRSRQQISPKETLEFVVRCTPEAGDLLASTTPYFASMAGAKATLWAPDAAAPAHSASFAFTAPAGALGTASYEVFVDLAAFLDVEKEIARKEKDRARLVGLIEGKEKKLSNASFVERAPADVVARERQNIVELREQVAQLEASLETLKQVKPPRA